MKTRLAALLLLLSASTLSADQQRTATLMMRYDVDSTSVNYCRTTGMADDPYGRNNTMIDKVKTSGSSTTVTSVGTLGPFRDLAVNDVIFVDRGAPGTPIVDMAVIVAKATSDSITVDAAVNWDNSAAGYTATWRRTSCGTTANDGWVDVASASQITMTIEYNQGDLDNLSVRWECKAAFPGGANPVQVYPSKNDTCGQGTLASNFCDYATAGLLARTTVITTGPWASCRIGFKVKTTDTSDAGANIEQVNAYVVVSVPRN